MKEALEEGFYINDDRSKSCKERCGNMNRSRADWIISMLRDPQVGPTTDLDPPFSK